MQPQPEPIEDAVIKNYVGKWSENYAVRTAGVVNGTKIENISTAFKEEDDRLLKGKKLNLLKARRDNAIL